MSLPDSPRLFLAPMEGVGDRPFRKAMAIIGGFDEATTEFMRVPLNAHVKSLAAKYNAAELAPIPLAAQIMGSDPELMAAMTVELTAKGAPRIDLNCGCPSNVVTGRGAGSSLLKNPEQLYNIAKAMVNATSIPVTAKLRSGYEDTTLFKENLLAAEESGVVFLTLHPRTKKEGYAPPANWDLIAQAKQLLKIPVVGNGDIRTVDDAVQMVEQTRCDALMIGRGSITNPWIFQEIKAHYHQQTVDHDWKKIEQLLQTFHQEIPSSMRTRNKINKFKQLIQFLFRADSSMEEDRKELLRGSYTSEEELLELMLVKLKNYHSRRRYGNLNLGAA